MRGGETATGKVLLEDDSIKVLGDSPQQFVRADLMSLTAGVPKESNYWTGRCRPEATCAPAIRTRSRPARTCHSSAGPSRTASRLDYLGNYSSTNDVESSNNHRANAVWDWFFSEKLFLRPVFFEYFKDPFQNVDRRYTLGTGIGYQLFDTAKTDWSIFAGPAYQTTRFDQVAPGESRDEDTAASAPAPLSKRSSRVTSISIYDYGFQFTSEEAGEYNHHMIGTIEVELTDALDFDLSLVWDRINKPRANADGSLPEQDDYRLIVGLGYDF